MSSVQKEFAYTLWVDCYTFFWADNDDWKSRRLKVDMWDQYSFAVNTKIFVSKFQYQVQFTRYKSSIKVTKKKSEVFMKESPDSSDEYK